MNDTDLPAVKPDPETTARDQVLAHLLFPITIEQAIGREASPLAQFFLQQSLIAFELSQAIYWIKSRMRDQLQTGAFENGVTKFELIPKISNPAPFALLNQYTLGQLVGKFEEVNPPVLDPLVQKLKKYNSSRKTLTHKLFQSYYRESDVLSDASKAVTLGTEILDGLASIYPDDDASIRGILLRNKRKKIAHK